MSAEVNVGSGPLPALAPSPGGRRAEDAGQQFVLEQGVRLSRSLLGQLQRRFFEQEGLAAWGRGTVPHYITSNPFMASAYAKVILAWLRDCHDVEGGDGLPSLDLDEPVYIVELGSGSGRFAFHFLKKFLASFQRSVLRHLRVKYVLSDFTERNVAALAAHPSFTPFVAAGILDFARFDVEHDQELELVHSGAVLRPGSVKNPVAVLANYFFDTIPHDVFRIHDGELSESLVRLTSSQPEPDLTDPSLLSRVATTYVSRPVKEGPYDDPALDQILDGYRERLNDTAVLFPCVALRCIRALQALSGGRLLLLTADKGYHREESLLHQPEPELAVHGSFSLTVNFHAIGQFFEAQGGRALFPGRLQSSLDIAGFLSGPHPGGYPETSQAFDEAIERCGPDDFFTMKKAVEKHYEALTLEQILAWVRMSGWDANIFLGCLPTISAHIPSADATLVRELHRTIMQVWDTYYPIGEPRDLPSSLAILLDEMAYHEEALPFYEHSIRLYGITASTLHHLGLCRYQLGHPGDALRCLDEALLLDPACAEAGRARRAILSELEPRAR